MSKKSNYNSPLAKPPALIGTWIYVGPVESIQLTFCGTSASEAASASPATEPVLTHNQHSDGVYDPIAKVWRAANSMVSSQIDTNSANPNPFIKAQ